MLDDFMSDQASLPLIEGHDLVHFIYRGEAKEMVLHSDFVGWRYEQPMHQVMGTDLYYHSCRLEQDARVTYRFTRNIDEAVIDSLNPKSTGSGIFGKASRLHVPGWRTPEHLREHTVTYRGKIDTLTYQSRFRESSIPVNVYLPPKYDTSQGKYPVVYIHDGSAAQTQGQFATSLDYLIGRSVRPTIVVFIPRLLKTGSSSQYIGNQRDKYLETFVNDLIPAAEQKYRTVSTSEMRANMGCGFFGGFMAFYATFSKPGTVGKLAIQSHVVGYKGRPERPLAFDVATRSAS
jgi:enterochelin esterase-like enzyme